MKVRVLICLLSLAGRLSAAADGKLLFEQGRYRDARPLLEARIAAMEKQGESPEAVLKVFLQLAGSLHGMDMLGAAKAHYTLAVEVAEKLKSPDLIMEARLGLVRHLMERSALCEAGKLLTRCQEAAKARPVAPALGARALILASELRRRKGKIPEAEEVLDEAVSRLGGCPDALRDLAAARYARAEIQLAKGELARARKSYREALSLRQETMGASHPEALRVQLDLGVVAFLEGDNEQARSMLESTLARLEADLGSDHSMVAIALNDLASVDFADGKLDRALEGYAKCQQMLEKVYGERHSLIVTVLSNRAVVEMARASAGAPDEKVEPLCQRAIAMGSKLLGPEHPEVGRAIYNLGRYYHETDLPDLAEVSYAQALAMLERNGLTQHPLAMQILESQATLLLDQGRHEEVRPTYEQLLAITLTRDGHEASSTKAAARRLSQLCRDLGDLEGAADLETRYGANLASAGRDLAHAR